MKLRVTGLVFLLGGLALPAAAIAPPSRYAVNADGTVIDVRTKLTWQRTVDSLTYTPSGGAAYCASQSFAGGGWRLPTRAELLTLIDPTQSNPAIDHLAFSSTPSEHFWSASLRAGQAVDFWNVNFSTGAAQAEGYDSSGTNTYLQYRVRCVR